MTVQSTAQPIEPPEMLRGDDVAFRLQISRAKAYRMMHRGEIPVIRFGKSIRVPREALSEWIAQHIRRATA